MVDRLNVVVASLMAVGVLAGCAVNGGVVNVGPGMPGFRVEFNRVAGSGTIPTSVIGNPFSVDKSDFDAAVADAVYGQYIGPLARFDTSYDPLIKTDGRIVFWFDPEFDSSLNAICGDPASLGHAPSPGHISMAMAFCIGERSMVQFAGTLEGAEGPTAPAFRQMLSSTTHYLTAIRDPMMDGDRCSGLDC